MNPDMIQEALAAGEIPKPKRERIQSGSLRRSPMKRGKAPKAVSEDRKVLLARWRFIKACMVLAQRRTNGYLSCMECGSIDPPKLELDHIIPAGNGGTWTPDNAQLLGAGPGSCRCHDRKHGLPMWNSIKERDNR